MFALRDPSSVAHTRASFPRGEALTSAFAFERSRMFGDDPSFRADARPAPTDGNICFVRGRTFIFYRSISGGRVKPLPYGRERSFRALIF